MNDVRNFPSGDEPIEFMLSSPLVVLIDPIVLDGLSAELQAICDSPISERTAMIRVLPGFMRVGVQQVVSFRPGAFRLGNNDFEETDEEESAETFDVDTGTVCIIDLNSLRSTAKTVRWERYDRMLRSTTALESIGIEMIKEFGGPFFGMLSGDISTPFRGDGRYRLRSKAPHAIS